MATAASLLALLETAIETRHAGGSVDEYMIRGRSTKYTPLEVLYNLRDRLKSEAAAEEAGGLPVGYGIARPRQ